MSFFVILSTTSKDISILNAQNCSGTLTWPNDQMAERPNRMAERPNMPIWSCPLFDAKGTTLKYYQNYGRY